VSKKKWPVWKNLELTIDVLSLIAENKRTSEFGACQYIADHPEKYQNRYPRKVATLHRQFLRAKIELARSESLDPGLIAQIDQDANFLATYRRIMNKAAMQQSAARNPRRKMHD
jgi:hypothetical protein